MDLRTIIGSLKHEPLVTTHFDRPRGIEEREIVQKYLERWRKDKEREQRKKVKLERKSKRPWIGGYEKGLDLFIFFFG